MLLTLSVNIMAFLFSERDLAAVLSSYSNFMQRAAVPPKACSQLSLHLKQSQTGRSPGPQADGPSVTTCQVQTAFD